ncbi:MAG: helix-turn-helix domain-containing protein [Polyangiaceae bacterium]
MSVNARAIKALRQRLGLTQQAFASLLGLSFVSVNKWENGGSTPTGLSAVLLELLESALRTHPHEDVTRTLRAAGGAPLDVVRTLTALERNDERTRS